MALLVALVPNGLSSAFQTHHCLPAARFARVSAAVGAAGVVAGMQFGLLAGL
jgi:hypothetical protein